MKNIFLYLFVFSFLINVFQYVNSTKILDSKDRDALATITRFINGSSIQ